MVISDYLSREELKAFRTPSHVKAIWQVLVNYGIIAGAFALFALWPNPLTFIVSAFILGGRILGLAILNHDAGHGGLFKTARMNRIIARWLFTGPILGDYEGYRKGHMEHHKHAGTINDPDIPFVKEYPVSAASMRRKFIRDLTGQTGFRDLKYLIKSSTLKKRIPFLVWHGAVMAALYGAGALWAYPLWWVAFVFCYPVILRIRVMGEHGNVADLLDGDVRNNTRTTLVNPIERLLISPNFVNYHCEHHVLPIVPGHNLPRLHRVLKSRNFYADHPHAVVKGYWNVISLCIGERHDRHDFSNKRGAASYANMS